jgi:hypothetical protein
MNGLYKNYTTKQLLPDYAFPYVDMDSAVQKIITTAKASLLTSHGEIHFGNRKLQSWQNLLWTARA